MCRLCGNLGSKTTTKQYFLYYKEKLDYINGKKQVSYTSNHRCKLCGVTFNYMNIIQVLSECIFNHSESIFVCGKTNYPIRDFFVKALQ